MRRLLPFLLGPLVAPLVAPLAGCAGADADYPSLELRDVERDPDAFRPAPPEPLPEPNAATLAEIDALVEAGRAAHARFMSALPAARRAAARRGPVGSEAWGDAQVALADLESKRSEVARYLGDLDVALAAARVSGVDAGSIAARRGALVDLVAVEDRALAALR